MEDLVELALTQVLAQIEAGETFPAERLRSEHPDCWREILDALSIERMLGGAPETIGPYRVVSLLGRGGMGTVYLAEDARTSRRVAVKVLAPGLVGSERALRRFRREAAVAARVEHPGICAVYEAGVADDTPYLVMRHVEGETLDRLVERSESEHDGVGGPVRLPSPAVSTEFGAAESGLDRVLLFVERTARALHVAHEAGLVHRDVKPGNVMVTPGGDPVILDFGLVRDDEDSLTRTGALVGTPAYMAPEQIAGRSVEQDRRIDVYALGVILFECVALARPFDAPTREALFATILRDEPPDLRRVVRDVSRDTALVVATALAKAPDSRYQTALDFAEDLRRARLRQPVRARAPSPAARLRRWSRRRPAVAAGLATAFVLLAVGLVVERSKQRRTQALALVNASKAAESVDPMRALLLAREAADIEMSREVVSQLHGALVYSLEKVVLGGHTHGLSSAVFSADGNLVLTASGDHTARIDTRDGAAFATLSGHDCALTSALFSPAGDRALTADVGGTVILWNLATHTVIRRLAGPNCPVSATAYSAQGDRFLIGYSDGTVTLCDADGLHCIALVGHAKRITAVVFSSGADGRMATASEDGDVRVWSRSGAEPVVLRHHAAVLAAAFSPAGGELVTGAEDGVRVWDLATRNVRFDDIKDGRVLSVAYSHDGLRFATGHVDGTARLWTSAGGAPGPVLRGHAKPVRCVAFSDEDQLVATAAVDDERARVWDVHGQSVAVLVGHTGEVTGVRFAPRGEDLLTSSADGTARIWGVKGAEVWTCRSLPWGTRTTAVAGLGGGLILAVPPVGPAKLQTLDGVKKAEYGDDGDRLLSARVSRDRRFVVIADWKGRVRVFDVAGDVRKAAFVAHPAGCRAEFSPDGTRILTWSDDGTAALWDWTAGDPERAVQTFVGHEGRVLSAAFSVDGASIVTGSADRQAIVWDVRSGRAVRVLRGHEGAVLSVAFAHHGEGIVTASGSAVTIFGPDDQALRTFRHDSTTRVAAFSPDDTVVAVGCNDGSTWLWDVAKDMWIAQLPGHSAAVVAAEFEPDGRTVCTACGDGNARVRYVDAGAVLEAVKSKISRDFTRAELERYEGLLVSDHTALKRAYEYVEPRLVAAVAVEDVVADVRADAALPTDVRAAALRILEQRFDDRDHVRRRAWEVVRQAGLAPDKYAAALGWAKIADDLWHENPDVGVLLGVALHRTDDDAAARKTLEDVDRRLGDADAATRLACVAALSLVDHALQEDVAARAALERLRRLDATAAPSWIRGFLDEAGALKLDVGAQRR